MQVTIAGKTVVQPNEPPFEHDHTLSLSHLDTDRNLHVKFRYLRAYIANTTNTDPFDVITTALSKALVAYYPFAGILRPRESDNRLELKCTAGDGVPVTRASTDCTLDSVNYLDDPDEVFVERLIPDPDPDEALNNPFMLQVTEFNCGGYTLGACVHHSMADGLGATQFFNAMAEYARGLIRLTVEPVWDRDSLLGPRNPVRVEYPVEDYLFLDKGFSPYLEGEGRVGMEMFHVKEMWLDRFKGFLFEKSGLGFTTFEAFGAFIWQAKVKASRIPANEQVKFAYSINIRKIIDPPLPTGYWGNGCLPMYVHLNAGDLMEQPIWETANLIKKSKRNVSDEYVRSFIDFQELNYEKGITAGKGVSGFTDWRHLGHSTVDFGSGGPVTVLPLSRNLLGSVEPCFFLPYSSAIEGRKDGFKVLVYLQVMAKSDFRDEMSKFSRMEFGLSKF